MAGIGFIEPPPLPMPPYSVEEGTACRTCSRLKITMLQENPHPRMRIDCDYQEYIPRRFCEFYSREPGTD